VRSRWCCGVAGSWPICLAVGHRSEAPHHVPETDAAPWLAVQVIQRVEPRPRCTVRGHERRQRMGGEPGRVAAYHRDELRNGCEGGGGWGGDYPVQAMGACTRLTHPDTQRATAPNSHTLTRNGRQHQTHTP